jgi:hypothetical protein
VRRPSRLPLNAGVRQHLYVVATIQESSPKWLRWVHGRQGTGYDKLLLLGNPFILPFDCYLLRFPVGTEIPPHRDPVSAGRHYRMNIILKRSPKGGDFVCDRPMFHSRRLNLFRSDICTHSVTRVEGSPRYVLSIGWVLRGGTNVA